MKKSFIYLLLIFIFGMAGGIFADQIFWPYFIVRPLFSKYNLDQQPVYMVEKQETIIKENVALEEAIEKVSKTIIGVRAKTTKGSGLAVTNDGLIVTLSSLIPMGQTFNFYLEQEPQQFQILKRDAKTGLALVKLEADKLSVVDFSDVKDLSLGQRIFMVSYCHGQKGLDGTARTVSQGIIKFIGNDRIETDIFKTNNVQGSPVFDIGGKLIGIVADNSLDLAEVIPVSQVKALLGS